MSSIAKLPRTVEELTPEWLSAAISRRCPGVSITSVAIDRIIWGTATKILMNVEYSGDYQKYGMPKQLCIKGEFDERLRAQLAGITATGTQIEAEFYNDIAPRLGGMPLLRHWYGGSEPGMGILILDNLAVTKTRFGTPTEPWSADLVSKNLNNLAILHASTWDKKFPEISWLHVGSPTVRMYNEFLMSEKHWKDHFVNPDVYQLPRELTDRERLVTALRNFWQYDDANAHVVIHGDAHLGNTAIDPAGQPYFIDWAGPCYSCWAFDVSNFIIGAMSVAERRAHEKDLVRHYLDQLAARGGPRIAWADAWDDYRRHIMNGIIWTTLPPSMQSRENVFAMGERYSTGLIDHDTLTLLGA